MATAKKQKTRDEARALEVKGSSKGPGPDGFSYVGIGKALGLGRSTVWSIFEGRRIPSLPVAIALARYLNMSLDDLVQRLDIEARQPKRPTK
jgi:DNA-binding XRE family transcriptional regulator